MKQHIDSFTLCVSIFTLSFFEIGLDKLLDFDIDEYVCSLITSHPITRGLSNPDERGKRKWTKHTNRHNKRIPFLLVTSSRIENLARKLASGDNEPITYDEIRSALEGIGVSDPKEVFEECKETIKERWSWLSKKYVLTEEEAVLISTYTYGEKGVSLDRFPYRIINKKLWEGRIKGQTSDPKSYLRLLLRALRKLPRTVPQTLYRGVWETEYKLMWKGFSSTTTSMEVTKGFLHNKGSLFEIRDMWGYSISDFSIYSDEQGQ